MAISFTTERKGKEEKGKKGRKMGRIGRKEKEGGIG
jgi:hypothetical protein